MHYIPESSVGEKCSCGKPANHKVEEVLDYGVFESIEDMISTGVRHPLTTYLCCSCFSALMGPTASRWCGLTKRAADGLYRVRREVA